MFMYDGISKLGSAVLIVRLRWFSIIELERSRTLLWRRCVVNEGGLESLTGACSRVKNCRLKAETDSRVWRGSEGHVCSLLARHALSLPPSLPLSFHVSLYFTRFPPRRFSRGPEINEGIFHFQRISAWGSRLAAGGQKKHADREKGLLRKRDSSERAVCHFIRDKLPLLLLLSLSLLAISSHFVSVL